MRRLLKRNPDAAIRMMIGAMTRPDPKKIVSQFSQQQRRELTDLFANMASGCGFLNDIKIVDGDATDVAMPTLIIHSKYDKSVPLDHPRQLARQ